MFTTTLKPMNLAHLLANTKGRNPNSKKIGNNTFVEKFGEEGFAIRLHNTNIVTQGCFGASFVFSSGGYHTNVTRDRLNDFCGGRLAIRGKLLHWVTYNNETGKQELFPFTDGDVMLPNGAFMIFTNDKSANLIIELLRFNETKHFKENFERPEKSMMDGVYGISQ